MCHASGGESAAQVTRHTAAVVDGERGDHGVFVGRKAQLPEALHDVSLHSVRSPSPCRRRRPRIVEVPLSQSRPLYGQEERQADEDRAPDVGRLEPQFARRRPSPQAAHKRRNGGYQKHERQALKRVADLAKDTGNPQKKRPRQRSLSPFVVITFDHARFFVSRGVGPSRCVVVLRGESVRGASPPRVKWTIALRLISAHLRPEESGGKPKVTHLCGQRPVVAAHDAVALRQRRLTVTRRHSFGFIIH